MVMINPRKDDEKPIRKYIEESEKIYNEIDPDPKYRLLKPFFKEVPIGAYRLDLVAPNANGGLTIVEFKAYMSKDALAQLLIYPIGLRHYLEKHGATKQELETLQIRSILVSPFIDKMVAKAIKDWNMSDQIKLRLVVKEEEQVKLVDPEKWKDPHKGFPQFHDQPLEDDKENICWDNGAIKVRKYGKWNTVWSKERNK